MAEKRSLYSKLGIISLGFYTVGLIMMIMTWGHAKSGTYDVGLVLMGLAVATSLARISVRKNASKK
jgi:hypothetical protein